MTDQLAKSPRETEIKETPMSKQDEKPFDDSAYYEAIGRQVEAEQKAAAEKAKKEAAEKTEDERVEKAVLKAIEHDRKRQAVEARKKLDRAVQAGVVGAAIFGAMAFITTLVEDDETL